MLASQPSIHSGSWLVAARIKSARAQEYGLLPPGEEHVRARLLRFELNESRLAQQSASAAGAKECEGRGPI